MGLVTRLLVVCAWILLLQGCVSPAPKPDTTDKLATTESLSTEYVRNLLQRAESAPPEEKMTLMLNAAYLLATDGDTDWARTVVNNLPAGTIPLSAAAGESYGRLALVNSYIATADGHHPLALQFISSEQLIDALPSYNTALTTAIREQRAQLLVNLQDYHASISERIALSELLEENTPVSEANNDQIWQTLMQLPLAELQESADRSQQMEPKGWYELAALSKHNQTNLRLQLEQVEHWARLWPQHPASLQLPADLQLLQQLVQEQPQTIAVLLPLSGNLSAAAGAIRDGLMAAFYESIEQESAPPTIHFYDTNERDINRVYDQAVLEGAQVVIGPLEKSNITELALRIEMDVPTLALNTIEALLGTVPGLYQFGLAIEDEAAQAAEQAWQDGHRRALAIAPTSQWGDRSVTAFANTWRELGGELIGAHRFDDNSGYSDLLKHALQLNESEQRAQQIRRMMGRMEFEPRRRQDIDMIYLAAHAAQARQIKPTLAFHYAGDITVYAAGQLFLGRVDPTLDQDMNGIRFSALPWFFNQTLPEKMTLQQYADDNANLQSLYALGVDSFHLYPRLRQLALVKRAHFYGQTGKLSLNDQGQFDRTQDWAVFTNGRARKLTETP